jgi:hypothetical protein
VETYGTSSNVSDFPALNYIVESAHDFLTRSVAVQPVDLQNVDVGAQSLHAGVHGVEDVLPRQPNTVDPVAVILARGRNRRLVTLVIDTEIAFG